MRKLVAVLGICLAVSASLVVAEIDLSDFDDDVMRTMDDTNKFLEPDITAKNVKNATEGVEILRQGLKWTEEYFVHKGNTDDAVKLAQEGQQHITAILASMSANDFDKAAASARDLTKNCRACHDLYKPLTK
ncbi:MAG: hypothetical protein JWM78_2310 [Verrucomicrobiaceae bacterium]|nr:hypothetical protein [Verrucomicrobiaceae bacterium]